MRPRAPSVALALVVLLAGAARAQEPEAAAPEVSPADAAPRPKPRPPKPRRPPKPDAQPATAAAPGSAPQPPALSLDAYVEAATTTIIAEQSCPGVRLDAGQLTNLRLSARVAAAQEAAIEGQLRARSAEVRQRLAGEGREAWCAEAVAAYGPQGSAAKGVLVPRVPAP